MSVTVKVQYCDKLFKLSPGVSSLQQVHEEMRRRYPKRQLHLEYYHQGQCIQDLAPLLQQALKGGKNSIKLAAVGGDSDVSRVSDYSIIGVSDYSIIEIVSSQKGSGSRVRKAEEPVVLLQEKLVNVHRPKVELPAIHYQMPPEFYSCYNCEGEGVYENAGLKALCQICQGRGELSNDHRYVQRMRTLFARHLQNLPKRERREVLEFQSQAEVLIPSEKVLIPSEKKEFPRVFKGLNKIFELTISEVSKIEKMEVGKEFTYQFEIHNKGKDLPQELQVVNCGTKEAIKVKTLQSGEKAIVELGPFKCQNEALLEQAFYLCQPLEDGWERLGYRFGLRVRGVKSVQVKKMESKNRDLIRNLKLLSGSRKSEEYIEMRLKAMDIDLNNLEVEDEILIEIIRLIQ